MNIDHGENDSFETLKNWGFQLVFISVASFLTDKALFVSENWEWFEQQVDLAKIELEAEDGVDGDNNAGNWQPLWIMCAKMSVCVEGQFNSVQK